MARERLDDDMGMIPDQDGLSSMGALRSYLHGISDAYAGQSLEDLAVPFNLPLKSRDGVLFVRGTGTDASDKPVTVNGIHMYRQNVWIKGRELVERLSATQYL